MRGIVCLLGLISAATPVAAQTVETPVKTNKICRFEIATGTMMPARRICQTVAARNASRSRDEEATEAYRTRGHGALTRRDTLAD